MARRLRRQLGRQHDQEHVGEERHRVDPVRQGADVGPPRGPGQAHGLPGVVEVADHQRERRAGEDPAVDQLGGKPEDAPAEGVDQQELNQVVEGEPEESVDVAADHPAHGNLLRRLKRGKVT